MSATLEADPKVLSTGSFGLVSRIEGEVNCYGAKKVITKAPFALNNLGAWLRKEDVVTHIISEASLAHVLLEHHKIGTPETDELQELAREGREVRLALFFE